MSAAAAGAEMPPIKDAMATVRHPLARTMLALTFTTGLVDAASYLGLDHVFTANMTGNVVLLGFGIAGSGHLPVIAPLVSLAAFLLGAGVGGAFGARFADRYRRYLSWALTVEICGVATAAVLAAALNVRPNAPSGDIIVATLAFAMGVRNAAVRRIALPDLTTTVLTMTLTALSAEMPLFGGSGHGTTRRVSAVSAMLAGAIVGALLLKSSLALPLVLAAVIALCVAVAFRAARDD